MRQPRIKHYFNGNEEKREDYLRSKQLLINAGIYRTLGNFGPYFPNKESRIHKKIKTFIIEDIEFTLIETEVMSFSFDSMDVSKPFIQKEAWFQTVKKK
jgi:hypothetical protein